MSFSMGWMEPCVLLSQQQFLKPFLQGLALQVLLQHISLTIQGLIMQERIETEKRTQLTSIRFRTPMNHHITKPGRRRTPSPQRKHPARSELGELSINHAIGFTYHNGFCTIEGDFSTSSCGMG